MADNDDDNLRIFDDVENVVKEVQEEEQTTAEKIDIAKTDTTHEPTTSTTNEVVDYDCREEEQRPAKRVKVTAAASSLPVKSIVASYVPVSTTNVTSIGDIISLLLRLPATSLQQFKNNSSTPTTTTITTKSKRTN